MKQIKLAKDCRRRMKGALMNVSERAAFKMMELGEAVMDDEFMKTFAKDHGITFTKSRRSYRRKTEDK